MANGKDKRGGDGKHTGRQRQTHFDYFAEIDGNKSGKRNIECVLGTFAQCCCCCCCTLQQKAHFTGSQGKKLTALEYKSTITRAKDEDKDRQTVIDSKQSKGKY